MPYGWVLAVVWLVFLIDPVSTLVQQRHTPVFWSGVAWVALIVFVLVYVGGFVLGMRWRVTSPLASRATQWWAFGILIGSAALTVPVLGGGALCFVPFVMSFASYTLPRAAHWPTTIVGIAATLIVALLLQDGRDYTSLLVSVAFVGIVNTVSTALMIRSAEARRLNLELATSQGREAVARDVHDLIGHTLTIVRVKAQLAQRLIDVDPERARSELADIEALTGEAISGVRESVAGVRSASLAAALTQTRAALRDAGISLRVVGEPEALSPAQSLTVSWILREATTNILRHASASVVTVSIAPGSCRITDDGIGLQGSEGNGLRGMRERAAMAGATLAVTAAGLGAAASGTTVELRW